MEESPVKSSELDTTNPALFIHPYFESSGTQTLTKIIHFLKLRSHKAELEKNSKLRKYRYKSADFYSIQEVMEMVKYDNSILPQGKTIEALNDTIMDMMDFSRNGKYKTGYLYPVLHGDSQNFSVKILIVTCPEEEAWLPTSVYRNIFTQHNKPIIKKYLSSISYEKESIYYTEPNSYLISRMGKTTTFNPYGLSILEPVKSKIRDAFAPYKPIPIGDFFTDILEYCSEGTESIAISKDYYIIKRVLTLNHLGNTDYEPEIYYHYFSLFHALEELIQKEFLSLSEIYGLPVSKIKINQYTTKLSGKLERDPYLYAEKFAAITEIVEGFIVSNRMTAEEKDLILSAGDGLSLLKAFQVEIQNTANYLRDLRQKKFLEILMQRIDEHFDIKKTLYIYDVERPFVESYEADKNTKENKQFVKKALLANFYNFEATTNDGKQYYYLLDPSKSISVLHNLAQLSQSNTSYANQYKICKVLREKMESDYDPKLDTSIQPNQKKIFQDEIVKFRDKEKKESIKLERKKSYNSFLAQSVGASLIFVMFYLYLYTQSFIPLILIPGVILFAYKLGDIFRKKKKSVIHGNPNIAYTNLLVSDAESGIYNEIVKKIISSKNLEVADRIMTSERLKYVFKESIRKLKEEKPSFNEFSEDTLITNLTSAMEKISMVVSVPKHIRTGKISDKVLFAKDHLKDSLIKEQMLHYCESLAKPDKNGKIREDSGFYKYLSILLDNNFKEIFG